MAVTRRDTRAVAVALAAERPNKGWSKDKWTQWYACVDAVSDALKYANPRFDYDGFQQVCETAPNQIETGEAFAKEGL